MRPETGRLTLYTNGDGIGNACDADINDDCSVNFADLALMKQTFFNGSSPGPGPGAPGNICQ